MSREKIKVPKDVYDELTALKSEIHFTLDTQDTVKKSEDRGYMKAANWIRQNENSYKVGFSWGFEPDSNEPAPMVRDIPEREAPAPRRTVSHPPPIQSTRPQPPQTRSPSKPQRKSSSSSNDGIIAGIKNWLNKYF